MSKKIDMCFFPPCLPKINWKQQRSVGIFCLCVFHSDKCPQGLRRIMKINACLPIDFKDRKIQDISF